jgi:hypothetical protein
MFSYFREFQDELRILRNMLRFIYSEFQDCCKRHTHWHEQLIMFDLRLQWILDNWDGLWQFASRMKKVEQQG